MSKSLNCDVQKSQFEKNVARYSHNYEE